MPTEIKLWDVTTGKPVEIDDSALCLERELEEWILASPGILGEDLLLIGQQGSLTGAGRFDLLGIDRDGALVVIELKRNTVTPRDAVTQALDYVSWLSGATEEQIRNIAQAYLGVGLEEAFAEHYEGADLPDLDPRNHRVLVVAGALDATSERIIAYLAQQYGVNINAVFFRYAELPGGQRLLGRAVLVPEGTRRGAGSGPGIAGLLRVAEERGVKKLLDILLTLAENPEVIGPSATRRTLRFGWRTNEGKNKALFAIAVAAEKFQTPENELDVAIPTKSLAEIASSEEAQIRDTLEQHWDCEQRGRSLLVRVRTTQDAERLAQQIRNWISGRETGASA